MKGIYAVILFVSLSCLAGCVSTKNIQSEYSLNQQFLPTKATIKVRRSGISGGAVGAVIQDGVAKIGSLGVWGDLAWSHDPGNIAVVAGNEHVGPTHVLVFPVEAGKTYKLKTVIHWGGRFSLEPENFPNELVVYEKAADSGYSNISDELSMALDKYINKKNDK
jgi:hypothetical protein